MRTGDPGGSGYDNFAFTDGDGRVYARRYSVQGGTDASDPAYTLIGYVGAAGGAWYAGKRAQLYDLSGRQVGDFEIADPNRRDWGGMVAMLFIAAVTAGAAMGALAPAAAGAGSAAPLGGSGAFLGEGVASGVGAWDAAAGLSTGVTGTAVTGAALASAGGTVASMAAPLAKFAAAVLPFLGNAGASGAAAGPRPLQYGASAPAVSPIVWLAGAGLALLALKG